MGGLSSSSPIKLSPEVERALFMPKTPSTAANFVNPALIALKPRPVLLLLKPDMKEIKIQKDNIKKDKKTTKVLLLDSIAQYLERNGFSKTLKKFRSEAGIKKEDLRSSVDLEEIYCKYLEMGDDVDGSSNKHKMQDEQIESNGAAVATGKKEKKKKKETKLDDGHNDAKEAQSEKMIIYDSAPDVNAKSNKEKKRNKTSDSLDQAEQVNAEESNEPANEHAKKHRDKKKKKKKKKTNLDAKSLPDIVEHHESLQLTSEQKSKDVVSSKKSVANSETEDKFKDKKKKKDKVSKSLSEGGQVELKKEKASEMESKKDDNRTSEKDVDNKVSKKRKRLDSEKNDAQPNNNKEGEELKRRKKDCSDEAAGTEKQGVNEFQETPIGQPNGLANGDLGKNGARSTVQKSGKEKEKENGEKEPPKPFQRVKVDDVVFVDDRLQDNSYWAKGGAENGYGAKAQEILGQVRGRGFRHEKTKKKRGTYRGGMIDMQSHSIKFSFSDDE